MQLLNNHNNMRRNIIVVMISFIVSCVYPTITAIAASGSDGLLNSGSTVSSLISNIKEILNSLIPLIIGAAVVVFLYGVLVFIIKTSAGNADGRKEGINFMIFGIIGIAVMVSIWGLVAFVTNTFGTTSAVPQFNTSGNGNL
jgi:ABC-type Fe3+ transport system permease subunit